MTTIINTPNSTPHVVESSDSSGLGFIVGILVAALIVVLFIIFGLPAIRNSYTAPQSATPQNGSVNVNLSVTPAPGSPSPAPVGGAGAVPAY